MAEELEYQDLSDAAFWDVSLRGATFRDVDLTGARISHSRLVDVVIDAEIDRLVVNGVDVTAYVNERDEWFDLRSRVRPTEPGEMQRGWPAFVSAWAAAIERARALPDERRHESVNGEWSFVQTLRHLLFATDKWFTVPVLGSAFHPMGLSNSGSNDFPWPGIDPSAQPSVAEALAARADRAALVRDFLESVTIDDFSRSIDVLENGPHPLVECIYTVFEEPFWHNRYARRDLDVLRARQ